MERGQQNDLPQECVRGQDSVSQKRRAYIRVSLADSAGRGYYRSMQALQAMDQRFVLLGLNGWLEYTIILCWAQLGIRQGWAAAGEKHRVGERPRNDLPLVLMAKSAEMDEGNILIVSLRPHDFAHLRQKLFVGWSAVHMPFRSNVAVPKVERNGVLDVVVSHSGRNAIVSRDKQSRRPKVAPGSPDVQVTDLRIALLRTSMRQCPPVWNTLISSAIAAACAGLTVLATSVFAKAL